MDFSLGKFLLIKLAIIKTLFSDWLEIAYLIFSWYLIRLIYN